MGRMRMELSKMMMTERMMMDPNLKALIIQVYKMRPQDLPMKLMVQRQRLKPNPLIDGRKLSKQNMFFSLNFKVVS
jgi:hypothetical protein